MCYDVKITELGYLDHYQARAFARLDRGFSPKS